MELVQMVFVLYVSFGALLSTSFLITMLTNHLRAEEGREMFTRHLPVGLFVTIATVVVLLFWPLVLLAKETP